MWHVNCLLTASWLVQGLGLVECAHDDESSIQEVGHCWCTIRCSFHGACHSRYLLCLQGLALATRLHLEFYSEAKQGDGEVSGLKMIDMPRLDQHHGNEHELFCRFVTEYHVPESLRYRVLCCKVTCCTRWHIVYRKLRYKPVV